MSRREYRGQFSFDLRTPCKDCPYRKEVPLHEGIGCDIARYGMDIAHNSDRIRHSCHKTDPESDSKEGQKHKGPIQHCAGYLIMLRKSEMSLPTVKGLTMRVIEGLDMAAPVSRFEYAWEGAKAKLAQAVCSGRWH